VKAFIKDSMIVRLSILLYLNILVNTACTAQVNYVQNGGFEQYSKCPYSLDQIKFATGWSTIDTLNQYPIDSLAVSTHCGPDYCNACSINNYFASLPFNGKFYQYPHTGNGMMQTVMYLESPPPYDDERDYMQNKLLKALIAGRQYCVTFFVNCEEASGYAVDHIGAYLDGGQIDSSHTCGLPQTLYHPQVFTNYIIRDTVNWIKVEGSFTATGNERFITIGNFSDNAHTDTAHVASAQFGNGPYGAYLVDDVSVVESATPAYAGGDKWIAKGDSVFIGRNEVVPDCMWYRNGVLIDTVRAGFWVKDTVPTTYVVKQSICGNVLYDSMHIHIAKVGVGSVGNESIFKVYPNPAGKEITIQCPNNNSTANVAISNMGGQVMMQQTIQFINGESHIPLGLPGGVYVIELVNSEGVKNIQRLSVL
jgi:hypothetical protein